MLRLSHILVQQPGTDSQLRFQFRPANWSIYAFIMAVLFALGAFVFEDMEQVRFKEVLIPVMYAAAGLFAWSSLYSYCTRIRLEIDGDELAVRYHKSNSLVKFINREWRKSFAEFESVRIWRPGRRSFLVVVLRLRDKQEIPLGTSEAGILGLDEARRMAENIAALIGVPVLEEPTAQRKL